MPLLDGSSSGGGKSWLLPLVVVLGASVYSWRVRQAEQAARRDKFEQHLGDSYTRDGPLSLNQEDRLSSAAPPSRSTSPTLTPAGKEESTVPPLTKFGTYPSRQSSSVVAAAAPGASCSLGHHESVVLSPMDPRDWSIRLFPDSLSGTFEPSRAAAVTRTAEGSVTGASCRRSAGSSETRRTIAYGEGRVQVGALSLQIRSNFSRQPGSYSFPLRTCSFVHPDGSRLYIMAEELTAARESVNTVQYATQAIERLRSTAQDAKTYFKVKLNTTASMIVTTIMERYVSLHIGPSPSIAICFFLVRDGVAYTVQLQCQPEEYENRLADVLMAVQTARIDPDFVTTPRGHNCYTLCLPSRGAQACAPSQRTYVVHLPTEFVVHQNPSDATVLLLTHAHSSTWSGEVRAMNQEEVVTLAHACTPVVVPLHAGDVPGRSFDDAASPPTHDPGRRDTAEAVAIPEFLPLIDSELYVYLNPRSLSDLAALHHIHELLSTPTATWAEFTVEEHSRPSRLSPVSGAAGGRQLPCYYISPHMRLPLPPVLYFTTRVCEHVEDAGVTLFIRESSGDLFEMELRVVAMKEAQLANFTAAVDSVFVAPVFPRPTTNAAGQRIISAEGLAVAGGEVTLRLDCVQVSPDNWLIIRWLFDDSNIFTRELEQYKERLYDTVFV